LGKGMGAFLFAAAAVCACAQTHAVRVAAIASHWL
jgi:hypothetical protein